MPFVIQLVLVCTFIGAFSKVMLWIGDRSRQLAARWELGLTRDQYAEWLNVEAAYGARYDDELHALFAEWKATR